MTVTIPGDKNESTGAGDDGPGAAASITDGEQCRIIQESLFDWSEYSHKLPQ